MASNIPYLKGVRTRYVNILKKETKAGSDILASDSDIGEENVLIPKINNCIERLHVYSEKVENQTDKLAEAIGESETELTSQLIVENETICNGALECVLRLKQFKEEINLTQVQAVEAKEKLGMNQLVELQKQMNEIVFSQMKQQHELLAKQELKEIELATTVKLPKLEIAFFCGDKLRWTEFWDAFENAVHNNKKLSNIEKFNYLRSKLNGEAKRSIQGLSLSNENYEVAIGILKERFGDEQDVIDLHYNKMINLSSATSKTNSLRSLLNSMEKHFRSLQVLKQNVNQDVFVSMFRAKHPEEVLLQLEIQHGTKNKWTVEALRGRLHDYITAREHAEKKDIQAESISRKNDNPRFDVRQGSAPCVNRTDKTNQFRIGGRPTSRTISSNKQSGYQAVSSAGSAEALVVNTKQISETRFYDQCRYCKSRHWSDECSKYPTLEERKKQLKDSCYRCLKVGHVSKECKRNKTCVYCGEINMHHRSLCPQRFKIKTSGTHISEEISELSEESACGGENVLISSGKMVLMQTAKSEVKHPANSNSETVRILLDSGSQRTYVTEKLAKQLQLTREREEEIKLITFGCETAKTIKNTQTRLKIKLKNGAYLEISANIVPVISGSIQRKAMKICSSENFQHLVSSLELADTVPRESESSSVEVLIGNDFYLDVILSQRIEVQPGLYFLASKLGWIQTGRTSDPSSNTNETNMLILTYGNDVTETGVFSSVDSVYLQKPNLEDFWKVESIGILDNSKALTDELVEERFKENLKFENGRYQVTWPWKEEIPDLPINRELAIGRLKSSIMRMKNKPELMKAYDSVIHDQMEAGIIEKVDETCAAGPKHYLPHHAVFNPLKPTSKLRIVYDASAKSSKEHKSLNECLYRGPVLLNDLCGLLMRFRLNTIAIISDIEKAFLQIGLQPDQRDVTRFVWMKDSSKTRLDLDNIQEYRFCRVPFGVISSPFLLAATIECHLDSYGSELAKKLKEDIYVDNVITGANNVKEAILLYREAKSIFSEASMNLREWITNNHQVNQIIEKKDMATSDTVKVLGHTWNIETDSISLKKVNILPEEKSVTKSDVLKALSSVFDPLGFFSPVLVKGKLLLQTLWSERIDWDEEISAESRKQWLSITSDLSNLSEHEVKRCVVLNSNNNDVTNHLMCFCDASTRAYAAVIYLLQQNNESESKSNLIFSKTRLAPLKPMTVPRLELMAVLIGTRCLQFVKVQLKVPIHGLYLWTDSQCVLKWIASEKDLSVFVRNRVSEIRSKKDIEINYISSKENPADIATRGSSVCKLSAHKLWWHGPAWLSCPKYKWPLPGVERDEMLQQNYESELDTKKPDREIGLLQVSNKVACNKTYRFHASPPLEMDIERFSTLTKMLRVTALALRFINKLKNRCHSEIVLSKDELDQAKLMWIRYVQRKHYSEVYESIQCEKPNNLQKQLGLYIDNDNILRCKGRIEHAELTESARRPVLLPKHERFTHLLVEKCHKLNLHSGVSQTLSQIRNKYWIPQGRSFVRSVLRSCLICRRYEGGPYKMPSMPPLPGIRVKEANPFSRTGLDYLGPLYVRSSDNSKKIWICLFTCLVTRALHLELVSDMTTEEFLLALRRFIAQRGTPDELISDNALQFRTASSVLDLVWKNVTRHTDIQCYVSSLGIKWVFIVEMAPWMGGFYERLVGLVKRALRKTLHRTLLTQVQLQTILKEVEATVNARPLVYVGEDIESNITLTPNHFLSLNPSTGIPELEYDQTDLDNCPYESSAEKLLHIWKKGQRLLQSFWKIWRDEYLLSLRERTQSSLKTGKRHSHFSPTEGDVVLIKDVISRGCWRLGRVIKLVSSSDESIRSAKIRLPSGRVLGRPLNLLFPIEVSGSKRCTSEERKTFLKKKNEEQRLLPARKAAKEAKEKIKQCLRD